MSVLGIAKSCCITLSIIISRYSNCYTFEGAFNVGVAEKFTCGNIWGIWMTYTVLFTCDGCFRLSGCSQVLLIDDMQEHVQNCSGKCHRNVMYGTKEMDSVQILFDWVS
jgi:hypothetical protein